MNDDLRLRVRPLRKINQEMKEFLYLLGSELAYMAMRPDANKIEVRFHFEEIENGEDDTAYVTSDDDGCTFDVYLDDRCQFGTVIDYMIHELAHVASWHHDEENDHGPEFGKSYAALYTRYLELYELYWC